MKLLSCVGVENLFGAAARKGRGEGLASVWARLSHLRKIDDRSTVIPGSDGMGMTSGFFSMESFSS